MHPNKTTKKKYKNIKISIIRRRKIKKEEDELQPITKLNASRKI